MIKSVFIAGLGLIGGSIALAAKKENEITVYGWDANEDSTLYALKENIIDESIPSFEKGVQQADLVVIATPVSASIEYIERLNQISLNKKVIVTDVCSVKKPIMKASQRIENDNIVFIGGHPMAGSHKHGIEAAKSHLFENAFYLLVPGVNCSKEHIHLLENLLAGTKSYFVEVDEESHDQMTGVISHFPHLIASSLVHQAKKWQKTYPFMHELAAGGFRDITRIASSHPSMWKEILLQNKGDILHILSDWIYEMNVIRTIIADEDHQRLETYLSEAKLYRDGLPVKKKGAIPSFHDLYVDIFDQPGALSQVTLLLANNKISIKNIQILEVREGITGVLRLSFQTEEDQSSSKEVLQKHGFETMIEY